MGNNVLIKLDRLPDELILLSGKKIFIDPTFEPEKNAAVTGSVVAVPNKLMYSPSRTDLIPWETEMELEINDRVICYFMSSVNAFSPQYNKWIRDENGEFYILVRYEHIYIAKRKTGSILLSGIPIDDKYKIIPLNGYCIIEPIMDEEHEAIKEKIKKMGLMVPPYLRNKHSVKYGIVKYLAKPNKSYFSLKGQLRTDTDENCDIKVGDKIAMRKSSDVPLEYEHHASLEGRKRFYRVQRRYITAIMA